jgi:hypothetical protein
MRIECISFYVALSFLAFNCAGLDKTGREPASQKEKQLSEPVAENEAVPLAQSLYPDPAKTPGVARSSTTVKEVCTPGFTKSIRNVSEDEKKEIFIEYLGEVPAKPGDYEIDHFISLELGGSNDKQNLWPEPYEPKPGAREKDVVETDLKRAICDNELTLDEARRIITTDWYACYKAIEAKQKCTVPDGPATYQTTLE